MRLCPGPLLLVLLLQVPLLQDPLSGQERRAATSEDIEAGARNFKDLCQGCHGRDGVGGRAPDLSLGRFRFASTDDGLFRILTNGRGAADGKPSPQFRRSTGPRR